MIPVGLREGLAAARRTLRWALLAASLLLIGIPPRWIIPDPPAQLTLPALALPNAANSNRAMFSYRLDLAGAPPQDFAVYFVSTSPNARLTLNGTEIYSRVTAGGPYVLTRPVPVMRRIFAALLQPGENLLVMETGGFALAQTGGPSVSIGSEAQLRNYYAAAWFTLEALPFVVMGASLLLGGVLLGLWSSRRYQRAYLPLSALLLLNCCKLPLLLSPTVALGSHWLKFAGSMSILQVSLLPTLVAAFVQPALQRRMWYTLPFSLLFVAATLLVPDAIRVRYSMAFAIPFSAACLLLSVWIALPAATKGRSVPARVLLGLGAIVAIVLVFEFRFISGPGGGLLFFGNSTHMMFATLIVFGVLLIREWGGTMDALNDANRRLEQELHSARVLLTESLNQRHLQEQQTMLQTERERLMRDLHDGVGNRLASALALCSSDEIDAASELEVSLRAALGDLRLVVVALNDFDGDLAAGIASFLPQLQRQARALGVALECDVADLPTMAWLRSAHIMHVLQILQEAVMNAARHSGARRVRIDTDREGRRIFVRDAGHGGASDREGSFGLRNMRERARALGGNVRVDSGADGTVVTLQLP
ncbi:MAG: hypothetical protein RJA34_972 [Pseudomonadota bacterium]|jgi:signal transduction histidine kinase